MSRPAVDWVNRVYRETRGHPRAAIISPRVVVAEYNNRFPIDRCLTGSYDPNFALADPLGGEDRLNAAAGGFWRDRSGLALGVNPACTWDRELGGTKGFDAY